MSQNSLPDVSKSNENFDRAKLLIPSATMLLSKRPDIYAPKVWPAYYSKAYGSKVEDIDGNVFTDMTGDVGATMLGRADPDVNQAVHKVVNDGNFCTMNYPSEVELAQLLTKIIPSAEQVRFVRGGGEADMVAIRIARGYTKRNLIAFCGYHGWHDWYLASNLANDPADDDKTLGGFPSLGVPRQLQNTAFPFAYNDLDALKKLLESKPDQFATIVVEPTRHTAPDESFLEGTRKLADEYGAVLIFDEVVTGFRMAPGGAQEYFGVIPDISTFAKTISNGYPMGAVVGKREVMDTVKDQFISSTYWTDAIGTAAALATLKKIIKNDVIKHVWDLGRKLADGVEAEINKFDLPIKIDGWPPLKVLKFEFDDDITSRAVKTLYTRYMLSEGFIATGIHYIMYSHTDNDIKEYCSAFARVLKVIQESLKNDSLMKDIDNKPSRPLFQRLTEKDVKCR